MNREQRIWEAAFAVAFVNATHANVMAAQYNQVTYADPHAYAWDAADEVAIAYRVERACRKPTKRLKTA